MIESRDISKKVEINPDFLWGIGEPTIRNHSDTGSCIKEVCPKSEIIMSSRERIVIGVKKAPYANKQGYGYALMCKCPSCDTIYWYHASSITAAERKTSFKLKNKE
ncbi:MAG: hypothetical protein ABH835_04000 [Patescibacteria group bacterium]